MVEFDWTAFVATADGIADRYVERTRTITELVDSSILLSDGFCVCALCEFFGVHAIVEGGTGYGGSTEMFARYFDGASGGVTRIWSVDQAVNPRWQRPLAMLGLRHYSRFVWSSDRDAKRVARARLRPFAHVTLVRGDAHDEIPRIVSRLPDRTRVAIMLDGPKGEEQMALAERLLGEHPSIRFVAVDDIGPMFDAEQRHARFLASPFAAFATSDDVFFDRYSWINAGRLPRRMIGKPEHRGYGMGVLLQRGQ